jgi:hypothetical protein
MTVVSWEKAGRAVLPVTAWLTELYSAWEAGGLDASRLFERAGLSLNDGHSPSEPLLSQKMNLLWHLAASESDDPAFALTMVPSQPIAPFGLYGNLMMACATLLDALHVLDQDFSLLRPVCSVHLHKLPGSVRVGLHSDNGPLATPLQRDDYTVSLLLRLLRALLGGPVTPRAIFCRMPSPAYVDAYATLWGQIPVFGCGVTALDFDPEPIGAPVTTAHPLVAKQLTALVADLEAQSDIRCT